MSTSMDTEQTGWTASGRLPMSLCFDHRPGTPAGALANKPCGRAKTNRSLAAVVDIDAASVAVRRLSTAAISSDWGGRHERENAK